MEVFPNLGAIQKMYMTLTIMHYEAERNFSKLFKNKLHILINSSIEKTELFFCSFSREYCKIPGRGDSKVCKQKNVEKNYFRGVAS